jgi:hypothetical protein
MKTWRAEGRFFEKKTDRLKRKGKEAAKAYYLKRKEK